MQVIDAAYVPPVRSVSQRDAALELANTVRIDRSKLRAEVRAGDKTAADVVLDTPACATTMTIMALLRSQFRWGENRARRFLRTVAIPEAKHLGSLTERQRNVIVDYLSYEGGSVRDARRMEA